MTATSVVILTGAPGAGKSTLLNAALCDRVLPRTAVVVNDDVLLLPGGCACCGMRSGLAEALLRLERGARRGELPPFERIVVETSGLAEPGAILQLFAESALLAGRFRVEAMVTVVDALLGGAALDVDGTGLRQVLLADRLVLTKWETLARDALQRLDSRLAQLNPFAERIRAPRGAADAAWLGHSAGSSGAGKTMPAGAFRAAHDDAIESFALHWDHLEPLAGIGEWLHALAATHAGRMLRVKGIVAAADRAQSVAVHAVQHIVSPPELLDIAPRASRVAFITRGLEPGDVAPSWPVRVEASVPDR